MSFKKPEEYTLEYIADRLQLHDLCVRYAVGVDRMDWDVFRSCFTEDAVIDFTTNGGPRGSVDSTVEFLTQAMSMFAGKQHLMINHEVEIDGDTATGRFGFYNPMPLNADEALFPIYGGWYIDEYKRTPEGWKMSSRTIEGSYGTLVPYDRKYDKTS